MKSRNYGIKRKKDEIMERKNVSFNGDILYAIQDTAGKIWVGVFWVLRNLGFSEGKVNEERKRIATDECLKQGACKFPIIWEDGRLKYMTFLGIDFLPIWLAKIPITPKYKKEHPDTAKKLVTYQLEAKDVLAREFLPKSKKTEKEEPTSQPTSQEMEVEVQVPPIPIEIKLKPIKIKLEQPDNMAAIKKIEAEVDSIYTGLKEFAKALENDTTLKANSSEETVPAQKIVLEQPEEEEVEEEEEEAIEPFEKWRNRMRGILQRIPQHNPKIGTMHEATVEAFRKLRVVYGFDVNSKKGGRYKAIYNDPDARVNFETVVNDLDHICGGTAVEDRLQNMKNAVTAYKNAVNDSAPTDVWIWKKIYREMVDRHAVDFDDETEKFQRRYSRKPMSRKEMVACSSFLYDFFMDAIGNIQNAGNAG